MPDIKWVKLYIDIFENRKIKQIRALPRGNDIVFIWIMLLTIAGRCNADGLIFITEKISYTPESLAEELKFKPKDIERALSILEQYDMISKSGDMICIPGWEEYQNTDGMERVRSLGRDRQERYRSRQRAKAESIKCNVTVTSPETLHNDEITQQNKKEETEEEKKKENKKEKAAEPPFVELILKDNSTYSVFEQDVEEWQKLYPDVNVTQEFRNMAGWCKAYPAKRKTRSGIKRFINTWLSRGQKEREGNGCTGRNDASNERDTYADEFDRCFS